MFCNDSIKPSDTNTDYHMTPYFADDQRERLVSVLQLELQATQKLVADRHERAMTSILALLEAGGQTALKKPLLPLSNGPQDVVPRQPLVKSGPRPSPSYLLAPPACPRPPSPCLSPRPPPSRSSSKKHLEVCSNMDELLSECLTSPRPTHKANVLEIFDCTSPMTPMKPFSDYRHDDDDLEHLTKKRISEKSGHARRERRNSTTSSQCTTRMRKSSLLASPTVAGTEGGIIANADVMKEKVRLSLTKPAFNVVDFYKKRGIFQKIARSHWFENVTLGVIAFNALWIPIDTDNNKAPMILDAKVEFQVVEHFFCVFFTLEWLIRFMSFRNKVQAVRDAWFCFDSILVATMVLETWVMSSLYLIFARGSGSGGVGNVSILRIARLLRLSRMARMARLLRIIPELVILVKGMMASMRSVVTTLFLLFIIMYVFGIAFAQLTADTAVGNEYFPTVPDAMYSLLLFGVLSLDWAKDIAEGLASFSPAAPPVYFVFVLLATFTVLNMLIGVLCEVVSAVAAAEKEQMLMTVAKEKLQKIMKSLDTDGNGLISENEYVQLLENPVACQTLHSLGVDVVGLVDFADVIFERTTGQEVELTFPEFMHIVLQLRGSSTATVTDIVELRKLVRHLEVKMDRLLTRLPEIVDEQSLRRAGTLDSFPATIS